MLSIVSIKHKKVTEILKYFTVKQTTVNINSEKMKTDKHRKHIGQNSPTLCEGMQLVGNKQVLQSPTQFPYTRNVVNVKKST